MALCPAPIKKSGKSVIAKSTKSTKSPKSPSPAYIDLIIQGIEELKGSKYSSRQALNKYVSNKKGASYTKPCLNSALKKGVESGKLVMLKASYKLSEATKKVAAKKTTTTKKTVAKSTTTKKTAVKKTSVKKKSSPKKKPTTKKVATTKKTVTKGKPVFKKVAAKKKTVKKA